MSGLICETPIHKLCSSQFFVSRDKIAFSILTFQRENNRPHSIGPLEFNVPTQALLCSLMSYKIVVTVLASLSRWLAYLLPPWQEASLIMHTYFTFRAGGRSKNLRGQSVIKCQVLLQNWPKSGGAIDPLNPPQFRQPWLKFTDSTLTRPKWSKSRQTKTLELLKVNWMILKVMICFVPFWNYDTFTLNIC